MSLTTYYIDKIRNIQQLLPILQTLDNDEEKQFKKYILNKEMNSLSNISHNIDNIVLEIIKLKFSCQSFCEINNRNDLLSNIKLDENLLKNEDIKNELQNDKENQDTINKFLPLMLYYSMMKKTNCNNEKDDTNGEYFGPSEKDN